MISDSDFVAIARLIVSRQLRIPVPSIHSNIRLFLKQEVSNLSRISALPGIHFILSYYKQYCTRFARLVDIVIELIPLRRRAISSICITFVLGICKPLDVHVIRVSDLIYIISQNFRYDLTILNGHVSDNGSSL